MADIIDIDVFQTVTSVSFEVEPNTNVININKVTGAGGGGGATNLSTTQTDINFTINSDTGDDALVPLGNGTSAGASLNNYTTTEQTKLAGIATGAEVNVNADWNATSGDAQILNKPTIPSISGLATVTYVDTQDALKVDKIIGKGLSTEDYTTTEKNKLAGIAVGAEVNVNADWNATSGDAQILNKPTIPSISGLATVTYVDTQDALKVDKVAGSRLITSAESTILGNTSGTNTGDQNLQSVTNLGASTTNSITANSFIKSGGTSSQILAANGDIITQGNNITITGGVISSVGGTGGGGSSVNYYLNGGTSQGTFGGSTYYEFSKTAVIGTGADFNISSDGYIASFITDIADPSLLLIPAGSWNLEFFFSSSSAGGSPSFYVELYKYDGTTFTSIASNSATPEGITNGTTIDAYFTALAVPETILTVNDRLAIRVFVNASSKTITLHTQNGHLCEVITTFTSGLTALNGLQAQVQNFAIGITGTDFNILSSGSTHTFNLPSASATDRGVITTGTQTIAGNKTFTGTTAGITKAMVGLSNVDNTTDLLKPISTATQTALNLKQPLATVLTNTTASFTTADETKLDKYPSTATNGKILQGNGTSYVEINTPTGTTNLGYTAATTFGTLTSSTGTSATIPLANGTNAGLLTADEKTKLSGIATGATANSSDATLLSRANHTGTQIATTISDIQSTITNNTSVLANTAKISFDSTSSTRLANTSGTNTGDNATNSQYSGLATSKVTANTAITGATNTKITYDSKGLVTAGTTLIATDIPTITQAQVTNLTTDLSNKIAKNVGATYTTNAIATVSLAEYTAIVPKDANTLYFII